MKIASRIPIAALPILFAACGSPPSPPDPAAAAPAAEPSAAAEVMPEERPIRIVFLGDSLTAGFGLEAEQAHPALIEQRLIAAGRPVEVVNAGVSGDTTAGGRSRLDWLLRQQPDVMVVSLGANDGLRGLELEHSEDNLRQIVVQAQAAGARVLLTGMMMPPNYGPYADRFAEMYPRLAEELEVPLVPFLLAEVAARPELNLPDGIHPNAEGQELVVDTVMPYLEPLVEAVHQGESADLPPADGS